MSWVGEAEGGQDAEAVPWPSGAHCPNPRAIRADDIQRLPCNIL